MKRLIPAIAAALTATTLYIAPAKAWDILNASGKCTTLPFAGIPIESPSQLSSVAQSAGYGTSVETAGGLTQVTIHKPTGDESFVFFSTHSECLAITALTNPLGMEPNP